MTLAASLAERFQSLFPTWPTVVATMVAVLILLFVLTLLLYRPVKKMHDNRRRYIQNNIDEAERLSAAASAAREQAHQEVVEAHLQASEIVAAARLTAQEARLHQVAATNEEISRMINEAARDIEAQQQKFEVDAREAVVELALAAASQVLNETVDTKKARRVVEEFVRGERE